MAKKKKMECCAPCWRNVGLMALRISIAAIFIPAGWMKLGDIAGVSAMLSEMGFPAETAMAYVLALVELVGGAAILVGFLTRWAAGLLAITMVVAILTAHIGGIYQEAMLAIAMLGSTLALAGTGAGDWKVWHDCGICKAKK